jgi:hypothetical protein
MGLFLAVSSIVNGRHHEVEDALREFANQKGGSLIADALTTEDEGCVVIGEAEGGTSVLYPWEFFDWDEASQSLSQILQQSVFSFHIHDSDFWMYRFFHCGQELDQFNPIPDYWGELSGQELAEWRGDAVLLAKHVPNLDSARIARYLVPWGDEILLGDERTRAYPSDRYCYGDEWQLVDFMQQLGFEYLLDGNGTPRGRTYRLRTIESHNS